MLGVVLAGGENTRLPLLKGFMEIGGRPVIEAEVELLRGIFREVVISANEPELYFYLGAPVIGDIIKNTGPAGGILSALIGTQAEEVFVTACDMPFVRPELIRLIVSRKGGDATVPVFNGRPEPLLAVYSRGIIKTLEGELRAPTILGARPPALRDILKEADTVYITEEEVREVDPEGVSFTNINTGKDFKNALRKEVLR